MTSITKIEYLTDGHGDPYSEKCEQCGRMVTWIATLSDGKMVGIDCAETLCLPEEIPRLKRKVKALKEYWNAPCVSNREKLLILSEAKGKDIKWALSEEKKLYQIIKIKAIKIVGSK